MGDVLTKGTLFPPEIVSEMVNTVKGKSVLAALVGARPVAFNGQKEFTFALDKEVDLVAENGAKSKGGGTVTPVTIVPVKVEYSMRVSDEFLTASESAQLDTLGAFAEGFAAKVARGIDLMALHGVNPRTGTASNVIGTNHFDSQVTQAVTIASGDKPDDNIESAIALVQGSNFDCTGLALSSTFLSLIHI